MKEITSIISCADLVEQKRRPVTATVSGILIDGRGYARPHPFHLDVQHLAPDAQHYFKEVIGQVACDAKDIALLRLENATVVGQGTVILADGSLLRDSAAEFINHGKVPEGLSGALDRMEAPSPEGDAVEGATVLLKRPWYKNFGHYLVDQMPILPALKAAGVTVDNIIYGDVGSGQLQDIMQRNARNYFPDANIIITDDVNALAVKKLLYVQPVHVPPLFKHPLAIKFAQDAARSLFSQNERRAGGRRLYLSRQKVGTRHIVNHEDLEKMLNGRGFETYYPERYSFDDQIKAFEDAEIVVGGKGAAFTNLMFCEPTTHVLVLSSSRFVDPFFWDLASVCGVQYSEIFCRAVGSDDPAVADFEVDLTKVDDFLNLMSPVSALPTSHQ